MQPLTLRLFCVCSYVSYRGHTVRAVCESFHLSKDAGFKVVAHMMPDLPNVGMERDVEQFIVRMICYLIFYSYIHSCFEWIICGVFCLPGIYLGYFI